MQPRGILPMFRSFYCHHHQVGQLLPDNMEHQKTVVFRETGFRLCPVTYSCISNVETLWSAARDIAFSVEWI